MPKFSKYDFVKFTKESREDFNLPCDTMLVTNMFQDVNGTVSYALMSWFDFSIYTMQKEEWLEGADSSIPAMTLLPTSGLAAHDLHEHIIHEAKKTVSILGTTYTIVEKPLKDCDGYCDKTTKEIAIATKDNDCDLGIFEEHRKKVLRHEIIHAYHHESGLAENFENKQYGFSETVVDWFAIQSPKIFKTFEELDIL